MDIGKMTQTSQLALRVSLWMAVLSVLFWLFGPVKQPGVLIWNGLWTLCNALLLGCVVIIGTAMSFVWLLYDHRSLTNVAVDIGVLISSSIILAILVAVGGRIRDDLYERQLDVVQAFCAEGFRDPSSLARLGKEEITMGGWEHARIWSESRNAIWVKNCMVGQTCGVVCIRPGIALDDAVKDVGVFELRFLREDLYSWAVED